MPNVIDNLPFLVDTGIKVFILYFELPRNKYKGSVCNFMLEFILTCIY